MSRTILLLLAEASLRATAAALLVGAALSSLRATSGAVRHAAWIAVLLAMIAMPGISRVAPAIDLPIPDNGLWMPRRIAAVSMVDASARPPRFVDALDTAAAPPPQHWQTTIGPRQRRAAGRTPRRRVTGEEWPTVLVVVYASVTAVLCVRLLIGWLAAARILRRSVPAGPPCTRPAFVTRRHSAYRRPSVYFGRRFCCLRRRPRGRATRCGQCSRTNWRMPGVAIR